MPILVPRERLRIGRNGTGGIATRLTLDPETAKITLRIARETTGGSVIWRPDSRISTRLRIRAGTADLFAIGRATGGIKEDRGTEFPDYSLSYTLSSGFFGDDIRQRLGTRVSTFDLMVELLLDGAPIDTFWSVESVVAPAREMTRHHSVAYDTDTDLDEPTGDGIISFSHTAGSGSNRAAFCHVTNGGITRHASTSCTYAGNAMAEPWDADQTFVRQAGYTLATDTSVPSGASTVENTLAGDPSGGHGVTACTFEGVDPSAPVGTHQITSSATDTTPDVTVTSLTTDGLIIGAIVSASTTAGTHTDGANQTVQFTEADSTTRRTISTQSSNDGGVIDYTYSTTPNFGQHLAAIEFKPFAAAAASTSKHLLLLGVG